ncbi:hypothetical protein P3342_011305 [Pyrenophora teres f. teres]|nr:hypothetical protein P3342_011305 [Pyrenophora teres f. teres]
MSRLTTNKPRAGFQTLKSEAVYMPTGRTRQHLANKRSPADACCTWTCTTLGYGAECGCVDYMFYTEDAQAGTRDCLNEWVLDSAAWSQACRRCIVRASSASSELTYRQ